MHKVGITGNGDKETMTNTQYTQGKIICDDSRDLGLHDKCKNVVTDETKRRKTVNQTWGSRIKQ